MSNLSSARAILTTVLSLKKATAYARPWGLFQWRSATEKKDFIVKQSLQYCLEKSRAYFRIHYVHTAGQWALHKKLKVEIFVSTGYRITIHRIAEDGSLESGVCIMRTWQ